jgi:N-6 DNA Methylase
VDLVLDLVGQLHCLPDRPRAIDPACGEGAFLRGAIERGIVASNHAFGIERDPDLAVRSFAAAGNAGPPVAVADALLGLRWLAAEGRFDLVLANPPFGTGAAGLREASGDAARELAATYSLLRGQQERVPRFPAEILFLELCLRLARPGGHVAIILPEGILANARWRHVREWLLAGFQVDAVVSLPVGTFSRTGAEARTAVVLVTKASAAADHTIRCGTALVPHSTEALIDRLDPGYWSSGCEQLLAACRYPLAALGAFIVHLTYGPIVCGRVRSGTGAAFALVHQTQVRFTGVDLSDARLVSENSPWVSARSMLEPGDVVLPRSGEGSLAKHKVAVFLGDQPAGVGSFVDLVRLRGLNPFYFAAFVKARLGRAQIDRIANGVGVPNISFGEIRALQVPLLPEADQAAIEQRYRSEVLPRHLAACARHAELLAEGLLPRRDPALRDLREVGERAWRAIIEELDALLLGS